MFLQDDQLSQSQWKERDHDKPTKTPTLTLSCSRDFASEINWLKLDGFGSRRWMSKWVILNRSMGRNSGSAKKCMTLVEAIESFVTPDALDGDWGWRQGWWDTSNDVQSRSRCWRLLKLRRMRQIWLECSSTASCISKCCNEVCAAIASMMVGWILVRG